MRKLLICVPMMTLLLTACAGGMREEEKLALAIRGEYLAAEGVTASAGITADYGRRVCTYQMEVESAGEEMRLTVTAPDEIAGVTARITGKDSRLEFEDLSVDTGPLDPQGLTPVSAIPALLEAARSGYLRICAFEGDLLRLECGDPEGTPGTGREIVLWFQRESHALVRGDILWDGTRVLQCLFSSFTLQ